MKKDFISIKDLTSDEIKKIFILASKVKEKPKKYLEKLKGKVRS